MLSACKTNFKTQLVESEYVKQSSDVFRIDRKAVLSLSVDEKNAVKEAAQALSRGQLVGFPTETVYGLGADAANEEALKKLYELKGRPSNHPVIVHLSSADELSKWCSDLPAAATELAKIFWPGPLTMVLKKGKHVLNQVTGGQDTVALRVPSHPVAQALLNEFGSGIAAPSANKFGKLSPTSADDVRSEFGNELAIVLDGGPSEVGIESSIVDLSGPEARILRPGMIQAESIYLALAELGIKAAEPRPDDPRVPGSLPSHYAPGTPLRLVSSERFNQELEELERSGTETAVLAFRPAPMLHRNWLTATRFPEHYAHTLYRNLRKLDSLGAELILLEEPPCEPEWEGIWDRLRKAAGMAEAGGGSDGS